MLEAGNRQQTALVRPVSALPGPATGARDLRRETMKTAALYARVSTDNGSQHPEAQIRELREHSKRRGWKVTHEYVDLCSGAKEKRPELDKLMADAHRRKVDVILVARFDRFARSVSHLLRALETFKALGIEFVSLSEQVDTSTPAGKLVFTVLGAVAELERSLIAERVRAGLRNARAKGKRLGRPRKIANMDEIKLLRAQGASWRAVGTALGVSAATAFCASARMPLKMKLKNRK
jgi:DNA invertase Pin-like site-specific DNA recombinase